MRPHQRGRAWTPQDSRTGSGIRRSRFAGVVLFAGLRHQAARAARSARYNIPAPVIGGLLVALAVLLWRALTRREPFQLRHDAAGAADDRRSSPPSASAPACRCCASAARWCCIFFAACPRSWRSRRTWSASALRDALGQPPLLGVLAGSVTLTGGPATGLAFAPLFEQAGVAGAATRRRRGGHGRHRLRRPDRRAARDAADRARPARQRRATSPVRRRADTAANIVEEQLPEPVAGGARRRRRRSLRAAEGAGRDPAWRCGCGVGWISALASSCALGRHACPPTSARCSSPRPSATWTMRPVSSGCRSGASTTSAASRCRCSWCWR